MSTVDIKLEPKFDIELTKRGYKFDGKVQPRVSTILGVANKPQLNMWKEKQVRIRYDEELHKFCGKSVVFTEPWLNELSAKAKEAPQKISGEAADLGTRIHRAIEQLTNGEEPVVEADMVPSLDAWHEWKDSNGLELKQGEVAIGSREFGFGGRLDQLAIRKSTGKVVLVDYKSGGVWPEASLQQSAYCQGMLERFGVEVEEAWVVSCPKDPARKFEAKKVRDIGECFELFKACLKIYRSNLKAFSHYE